MTGPTPDGLPPDAEGPSEGPGWSASPADREAGLAAYLARHGTTYTPEALRRAALDAGFTDDEIARATERANAAETLRPIRNQARWIVLGAYAVVWLLFAGAYLLRDYAYGTGVILQGVLTVALVIVLAIGLVWVARARPDSTRTGRALVILLVVPVVLLVGVAGLCVPFLGIGG